MLFLPYCFEYCILQLYGIMDMYMMCGYSVLCYVICGTNFLAKLIRSFLSDAKPLFQDLKHFSVTEKQMCLWQNIKPKIHHVHSYSSCCLHILGGYVQYISTYIKISHS